MLLCNREKREQDGEDGTEDKKRVCIGQLRTIFSRLALTSTLELHMINLTDNLFCRNRSRTHHKTAQAGEIFGCTLYDTRTPWG